MKSWLPALVLAITIISCKKDRVNEPQPITPPAMNIVDLHDTTVVFNRGAFFDVDGDGSKDIYFSTLYVGDPVEMVDKKQWRVMSSFYTNLPVNKAEDIPDFSEGAEVPVKNFDSYSWYNASSVVLAQKIIPDGQPAYWTGIWKDAAKKYVAFQVLKNNGRFNGWVEVSFDTAAEKIILHRYAISQVPERTILAGR